LSEYSISRTGALRLVLIAGPSAVDKLLGGIQAVCVLEKLKIFKNCVSMLSIEHCALDKVTLGLLEQLWKAYRDLKTLAENVPTVGLLELTREDIRKSK
jgi:hypothetical protein